tara:strand:+ start:224 stop:457 length:234 start_codon:yes stop_codon:yes gene_type:complete
MEISELKCVFDAGGLKSAIVTTAPLSDGYIVIVINSKNKQEVMTAQRSNKEPRIFKSISAAITNATNIGFREVLFKL